MIIALSYYQHVAFKIFVQNIPGLVAGILQAANSQTLSLANGVIHQALVPANFLAIGCLDIAGLGWQVLPHLTFWSELRGFVEDGVQFSLSGGGRSAREGGRQVEDCE